MRIEALAAAVAAGALSGQAMMNIMADENIIPKALVAQDVTPGGSLADSEKPIDAQVSELAAQVAQLPAPIPAAKGRKELTLIDEEWDAALDWVNAAQQE